MNVNVYSLLLISLVYTPANTTAQSTSKTEIVLEDFEAYDAGSAPDAWKRPHKRSRAVFDLPKSFAYDDDFVDVEADGNGKTLKVYTRDNTEQIVLINGESFSWNLDVHPILKRWKAIQLPEGAREDKSSLNDSGAALYVTFDSNDWLGRPRTIKYVYSSSLDVGTEVKYAALRIVVLSSGKNTIDRWIEMERNVRDDYLRLFGKSSAPKPRYIMIWGDSDNTHSVSEVFFDDIGIRAEP